VSLAELERERRRTLLAAGLLAFSAGLLFLLGLGGREWAFFLGGLLFLLAQARIALFRARVKRALVSPLAEALGFRYSPERGFSREETLASGLFPSPDRYEAEDLVEGEVGGIPFASSDIALYRKVRTRNGTSYQRFFGGTLYRFHLPFAVEGEVRFGPQGRGTMAGLSLPPLAAAFLVLWYVLVTAFILFALLAPERVEGPRVALYAMAFFAYVLFPLALFGPRLLRSRKNRRVVLESPEFERLFDAYGEDQVGARKLLTPRMQEALVAVRCHLGKPLWGAVRGEYLWLAVEGKDRFPVPLFRPVTETYEAWKARYREELLEAFRVAEALRLEEEARRRGAFPGGT
jgi:hypothetical protein